MDRNEIIKQAIKILKLEEGWRGYIYDDANGQRLGQGMFIHGNPTVGYGFTQLLNDIIPQDLYDMFPRWGDLGLALHVKKIIDYDMIRFNVYLPHLNEARTIVLICMIFQLGASGVLGFENMLKAIIKEDWQKVKKEGLDSKWHNVDTPERAERMMEIMEKG